MVAQEVGDLLVGGDEASERCEGFGECAHDEVDVVGHTVMVAHTAAPFAKDSYAVGFVDHHRGVVLLGQTHDFLDVGYVAFHREDGVADDELDTVGVALLELFFERLHLFSSSFNTPSAYSFISFIKMLSSKAPPSAYS